MAAHYRFDVRLYRRPANAADGPLLEGVGEGVPTLTVPVGNQAEPMAVTFDEAIDRLAALPGCYAEPDGSIVWTESASDGRWQVDGNLYDRGGHVIFASLTGHCPAEAFDRLLACFGWPEERMMLELVRAGVFLSEADFRRLAAVS